MSNKKIEIPAFLMEMSKQLNEQGNRGTSDPIFCVYYYEKIPTSQDYSEGYKYVCKDEEIGDFEALKEHLREFYPEFVLDVVEHLPIDNFDDWEESEIDHIDLPEDAFRWDYLHRPHFVKASLTEAGAKQFIARKQHDYPPLYIYAESMCFQNQMIELRDWIKSLS